MAEPKSTIDDLRGALLALPLDWYPELAVHSPAKDQRNYGQVGLGKALHGKKGRTYFSLRATPEELFGYSDRHEISVRIDYYDQDILTRLRTFVDAAMAINLLWVQHTELLEAVRAVAREGTQRAVQNATTLLQTTTQQLQALLCGDIERQKTDARTSRNTKGPKSRQKPPRLPRLR